MEVHPQLHQFHDAGEPLAAATASRPDHASHLRCLAYCPGGVRANVRHTKGRREACEGSWRSGAGKLNRNSCRGFRHNFADRLRIDQSPTAAIIHLLDGTLTWEVMPSRMSVASSGCPVGGSFSSAWNLNSALEISRPFPGQIE
jgi:hypothetical protein